jgi:hypothetical protein
MSEHVEPWPEPVRADEIADKTRDLLRRHTQFNEHELVAATCYILATWVDGESKECLETDASRFRANYPKISEDPIVQQLVHLNYKIGRS